MKVPARAELPFSSRVRRHSRRVIHLGALAIQLRVLMGSASVRGGDPEASVVQEEVARVEIKGSDRTRTDTVLGLLPGPLPRAMTTEELGELERRLNDLEIFDHVRVIREANVLKIDVREKWTLIPSINFITARAVRDLYAAVGVTETNAFGLAGRAGILVSYQQQRLNFDISLRQHAYSPNRGAGGARAYLATARFDFASEEVGWDRKQAGIELSWTPPIRYESTFGYQFMAGYYRETVTADVGITPPPWGGHGVFAFAMITRDRYFWRDLQPTGYRLSLSLVPGWLLGSSRAEPRHSIDFRSLLALALGPRVALLGRAILAASSPDNPNFSVVVGSIDAVRGLPDNVAFSWARAITNVELRGTLLSHGRWAAQAVSFVDAGVYSTLDSLGRTRPPEVATSGGLGVRIIPTFLAGLLLRLDFARLVAPRDAILFQAGLAQYF